MESPAVPCLRWQSIIQVNINSEQIPVSCHLGFCMSGKTDLPLEERKTCFISAFYRAEAVAVHPRESSSGSPYIPAFLYCPLRRLTVNPSHLSTPLKHYTQAIWNTICLNQMKVLKKPLRVTYIDQHFILRSNKVLKMNKFTHSLK